MLFDAGADRYLLRHETANEQHYQKLHPESLSASQRKQCLYWPVSYTHLDGEMELDYGFDSIALFKGDSVLVPADMGEYELTGSGTVLLSSL